MNNFLKKIIFICLCIFGGQSLKASLTQEAAMGLDLMPWIKQNSISYASKSVTQWRFQQDIIFFDIIDDALSTRAVGGFTWQWQENWSIAVFSGMPVFDANFNSGLAPRGFFSFSGDSGGNTYTPFFNTITGDRLDSAANSSAFGNLPVKVNLLDDPGQNLLMHENIAMALIYSLAQSSLGVLLGYGYSEDLHEFFGSVEETLRLFKSQLRFALGFAFWQNDESVDFAFDFGIEFKVLNLANTYDAFDLAQRVQASVHSAGAFEVTFLGRSSFTFHPSTQIQFFAGLTIFDDSTSALAQSNVQPFLFNSVDNFSRNGLQAQLGASLKYMLNRSVYFLFGTELNRQSMELFYDGQDVYNQVFQQQPLHAFYSLWQVPAVLSFQASLSKAFDFYLALKQNLLRVPSVGYAIEIHEKYRDNVSVERYRDFENSSRVQYGLTDASLSAGFSYYFHDLRLDWLASLNLFREGPFFISGKNDTFSLSFGAVYSFKKLKNTLFSKT